MPVADHDPPSSPLSRPVKLAKMEDSIDISEATTALAAPSSVTSSRTTPVPSSRPDAKARRYDRQSRLWASAGQRSLESARILLVGHDASACQTLKNLVLPGIKHFTILSDTTTTAADVGTNFFLEPSSIGKPIAQEEVRHLCELNPAVTGEAKVADASESLKSDPSFFTSNTLVITSNVSPQVEDAIAELLWNTSSNVGEPDIPLVSIRSSGLTGRSQIQLREHCVVDSHPDTTHTSRIDQPFPSSSAYSRDLNFDGMDSMEHSHVPWVVSLVRAATVWRESHDGKLPNSKEEKDEFKKLIQSWRRKGDEENFDEALAQAYRVWTPSVVPYDIAELLKDPATVNISSNSKNLHLSLHTSSKFLETAPHSPPVAPTLPDMHSSTKSYVTVQNSYKQQHSHDLARFSESLGSVLESIGLPDDAIPSTEVESFVKNVGGVAIIKGTPLKEAKTYEGAMKELITEDFGPDSQPQMSICIILAILASEEFYKLFGKWPGQEKGDPASDVAEVERLATKAIGTVHCNAEEIHEPLYQAIEEVVRGGFLTPPTTAAFFGGLAGQEVIKSVTNQYIPLDNTASIDSVKSAIDKFKL